MLVKQSIIFWAIHFAAFCEVECRASINFFLYGGFYPLTAILVGLNPLFAVCPRQLRAHFDRAQAATIL